MATLIVNRPRQYAGRFQSYGILVDGHVAATIANGKTVEIEIAPGRHQVIARLTFYSSLPVEVEAGLEGIHHLRVGSNWTLRSSLKYALMLTLLPAMTAALLVVFTSVRTDDPINGGWFILTLEVLFLLPAFVQFVATILWRHQYLYLEGIATPDDTARRVVLPRSQPLRARITIRGAMIAIAALAVLFGTALEWTRSTWKGLLQRRADYHSKLEDSYRRLAQGYDRATEGLQSTNPNAAFIRQAASKATAMADYYSAMRRKYEDAAARRRISVEPDPPEPPWP